MLIAENLSTVMQIPCPALSRGCLGDLSVFNGTHSSSRIVKERGFEDVNRHL